MSEAISIECPKCHAKLKLKNRSSVGKRVPCPKCKTPFVVKAPADNEELDFMNIAEPEPDDFADEAESEEDQEAEALPSTPRRSSSRKPAKKKTAAASGARQAALIGGIVFVLLAALGGAGYVILALLREQVDSNKIDLAWTPPDAEIILHARPADAVNSPIISSLVNGPMGPQVNTVLNALGIDAKDIRTLTFGAQGVFERMRWQQRLARTQGLASSTTPSELEPPNQAIMVLRTVQPFDREQMKSRLQVAATEEYLGQTIMLSSEQIPGLLVLGFGFFFADNSTLVMGTRDDLRLALDRGAKRQRRADIDFIDASRQILFVIAPKDPSDFDMSGPISPMAMPQIANLRTAMKDKLKAVCIGLSFGENVDFWASVNCTSADVAKQISGELNKNLEQSKLQFNQLRSNAPPMLSDLVITADSILGSVAITTDGALMETKLQIPSSIKNTLDKLPQLMMSGMLGGMPGGGGFFGGQAPGENPPDGEAPDENAPGAGEPTGSESLGQQPSRPGDVARPGQ